MKTEIKMAKYLSIVENRRKVKEVKMIRSCILFCTICIVGFYNAANGQQIPQVSHNMFNNMTINPGSAGINNAICATAIARQQWVGFQTEDETRLSPQTYNFTVDAPIEFIRGGLGISFVQDQIGFETSLGAGLTYAYHHDLTYGTLGVGLQAGFLDKRLDFSNLSPISDADPVLSGAADESRMFFDFALGGFYKYDETAWAGLSVMQLSQTKKELANAEFQLRRHYFVSGGYNHPLGNFPNWTVSPSLLLKTDLHSVQLDLNAFATYNKRVWGGVSYRLQDAVVVFLGLNIEQINIGYSYDITTSSLGRRGRSWGSHEIMVQYCFNLDIERINEIHRNTRFL